MCIAKLNAVNGVSNKNSIFQTWTAIYKLLYINMYRNKNLDTPKKRVI